MKTLKIAGVIILAILLPAFYTAYEVKQILNRGEHVTVQMTYWLPEHYKFISNAPDRPGEDKIIVEEWEPKFRSLIGTNTVKILLHPFGAHYYIPTTGGYYFHAHQFDRTWMWGLAYDGTDTPKDGVALLHGTRSWPAIWINAIIRFLLSLSLEGAFVFFAWCVTLAIHDWTYSLWYRWKYPVLRRIKWHKH